MTFWSCYFFCHNFDAPTLQLENKIFLNKEYVTFILNIC